MGLPLVAVRSASQFKSLPTLTDEQFDYLSTFFSSTDTSICGVSIEVAQQNLAQDFVFPTAKELRFYTLFCMKNDTMGATN